MKLFHFFFPISRQAKVEELLGMRIIEIFKKENKKTLDELESQKVRLEVTCKYVLEATKGIAPTQPEKDTYDMDYLLV